MKRILSLLVAFLLLALMLGILVVTVAIYDTGNKSYTTTKFFSVNALQYERIDEPKTTGDLGDIVIRDMLVKKYVTEYFYVIPDVKNVEQRMQDYYTKLFPCKWCLFDKDGMRPKIIITPLYGVGVSAFNKWKESEALKIKQLAEKGALRTVNVTSIEVGETGYLIVDYELKTWFTGNNIYETPTVTKGRLYMDVKYTPGTKQTAEILQRLEDGWDAATAFNFIVGEVILE